MMGERGPLVELSSIILFVLSFALIGSFFWMLNKAQNVPFGLVELIFAFVLALAATFFLAWTKSLMRLNLYLGFIFGLGVVAAAVYALSTRYSGPYTSMFMLAGTILTIVYLIYQFYILWKENKAR